MNKQPSRHFNKFIDKYYYLFMILLAPLFIWLNYYARNMHGILRYYEDFKRIILHGFDPNAALHGVPTFPMWGYGWILLITENQLLLLIIQNALTHQQPLYLQRFLLESRRLRHL